jgi:hypothetical protein
MRTEAQKYLEYIKKLPFPRMGKNVGDFALYDSLLVGFATRYVNGESLSPENIPAPDAGTRATVSAISSKTVPSKDEAAFVAYFKALESLRNEMLEKSE